MFDRDGIWEMNRAHHAELLAAATAHRRLTATRCRRTPLLDTLRRVLHLVGLTLRGESWTTCRLNQQGT